MRIAEGKNKNELVAYGSNNQILGKGYFYASLSSEIYEKERYNIFIDIEMMEENLEGKDFIFNRLMDMAKSFAEDHKGVDVRVYNCCFADNEEAINYYSQKEGFNHDEGMYLLQHDLATPPQMIGENKDIEIVETNFDNANELNAFVEEHRKIFRRDPYTVERVLAMKKEEGFKVFLVWQGNSLMAASLLYVIKEEEKKIGWVEDMFVSKGCRRKGLGHLLMVKALEYFKAIGVDESRLEVWSANNRALNLYYKVGYQLYRETEVSIGKFIIG